MYHLYYILGRIRRKYCMQLPETEHDMDISRRWLMVDSATANIIGQLIGGTFLAALLKSLNINDSINGIVSSIVTLLGISQLLSGIITSKFRKKKPFVCIMGFMHRFMLSIAIMIPYFNINNTIKICAFIFMYIFALLISNIMSPISNSWIASIIPKKTPGLYLGRREMVIVTTIMITNFICGYILDYFEADASIKTGFVILGIFAMLCAVINFYAISQIREPSEENIYTEMHGRKYKTSQNSILKHNTALKITDLFKQRKAIRVLCLLVLWQTAFQLSTSYINIYQISELNLSYTYIMALGIICNILRIVVTPICSKIMNKEGCIRLLMIVFSIMGTGYLIHSFAVPHNAKVFYVFYAILINVAYGGIGIGLFAAQIEACSEKSRTLLFGINATVMGAAGFMASVIGGIILNVFQNWLEQKSGIYGQQFLAFLSFLLFLTMVIYLKFMYHKNLKEQTAASL